MRPLYCRLVIPLLCFLPLTVQSGCARNPVTGDLQLALISESQEIQMGLQAAEDVAGSIGLVEDPELQEYVSQLGQRLAAASERPDLPWSFAVVDDPTPNAFALPGGPIFVTRGLLTLMSTEAQLVSVLGHEIGHVTARHHVTSLSRQQLAQIGLGVGGILFPDLQQLGGIAGAGLELIFLSHGRDAERQADDLGFRYSLEQGYDVREMALVFESLQRLGDEQQASAIPSWMMTHPAPAERVQAVQERIAAITDDQGALRIGTQAYLTRLEGLVYGADPRNGFFRDGRFFHPDMRFQMSFPGEWQTQNLAQSVMALSPQRDAAIQLTLAEDASPSAAARRFLSQQGIQPGQSTQRNINGLPAVLTTFRAQTQQGQTLQGTAGFIAHGGRVFQIMGYTPVESYAAYDQILRQSIGSFQPLTDPEVLNVQPSRISVVRIPEAMTLAEFHRRYPSTIPVENLAVLNQVPSPSSVLPGGTLMKRITVR